MKYQLPFYKEGCFSSRSEMLQYDRIFQGKNCSDPNILVLITFMEDLIERSRKEDVERQALAGQSNEYYRYINLLLL
jgi:hypothetical protein